MWRSHAGLRIPFHFMEIRNWGYVAQSRFRIGFIADPDPAFYLNADLDSGSQLMRIHGVLLMRKKEKKKWTSHFFEIQLVSDFLGYQYILAFFCSMILNSVHYYKIFLSRIGGQAASGLIYL
jgi:hypothetical protein